jgi:hypothetical protein
MHTEARPRVRAAHRSQDRRAYAMACYICQKHDPAPIGQFLPIIEVAAGMVRSSAPTVYLESCNLRSDFW